MTATASPIVYGTSDGAHPAVGAVLEAVGNGKFAACTGTVVQVKGDVAYVLTAAHCCDIGAPEMVVLSADYHSHVYELLDGPPYSSGAFPVAIGSVYYDAQYDVTAPGHDFCMLQVHGVGAGTPAIPLATPGMDGLVLDATVEHVGYGRTEQDLAHAADPTWKNNQARRSAVNTVDVALTPLELRYSQGGAADVPGACNGDSGGPTLFPANAPQAQQQVVGTISNGTLMNCVAAGETGTSSRVTSENGPGGFLSSYLADTPIGTKAVVVPHPSCKTCQGAAQSGACAVQTKACLNDKNCKSLGPCIGACGNEACVLKCEKDAGPAAVQEILAFDNCLCTVGCANECTGRCGTSCGGVETATVGCTSCLDTSCCAEAQACADDAECRACLIAPAQPASCGSNATLTALDACLTTSCAAGCALGPVVSSSSASSSSAATSTSASSGGGAGGAGGGGAGGSGGSGGPAAGDDSGCSYGVARVDDRAGARLAALAVLALASRRRRASQGRGKRGPIARAR